MEMEKEVAIARVYIEELSKTEKGREILRKLAASSYVDGLSMLEQMPKDLADEFTKTLNEVYENLIKADRNRTES